MNVTFDAYLKIWWYELDWRSVATLWAFRFYFAAARCIWKYCESWCESKNNCQNHISVHRHHHQHYRHVQESVKNCVKGRNHSFPYDQLARTHAQRVLFIILLALQRVVISLEWRIVFRAEENDFKTLLYLWQRHCQERHEASHYASNDESG